LSHVDLRETSGDIIAGEGALLAGKTQTDVVEVAALLALGGLHRLGPVEDEAGIT
jgi:hypothetical protein